MNLLPRGDCCDVVDDNGELSVDLYGKVVRHCCWVGRCVLLGRGPVFMVAVVVCVVVVFAVVEHWV